MAISVNPSVIALVGTGWKSVGGQMLASGVLLLSGYQDIGLRSRIGAAFGFFMAIAFGISALITAIRANLSHAAAICAVVLCSETFLILRWWLRRPPRRHMGERGGAFNSDSGRDTPTGCPPHRPGRALISASSSYRRKSFAGRSDAILFWRLSRVGLFQQTRLIATPTRRL
jgi:hypothetical protein